MDQHQGLVSLEVNGDLKLMIANPALARVAVKLASTDNTGFQFRCHPNMNKQKFSSERVLMLKDPTRSFPAGPDKEPLGVLKWRRVYAATDEDDVPLRIGCWPSPASDVTSVTMEYELLNPALELHDVTITIPVTVGHRPVVDSGSAETQWDQRSQSLVWTIDLVDEESSSGSMEFKVPCNVDPANLFPVNISFTSPSSLTDIRVESLVALPENTPAAHSVETRLSTDAYDVQYR